MAEETTQQIDGTAEYARVELMGHRTRYGRISEVTRFGAALLRVDFYDGASGAEATEYYSGSSIYCWSPVAKDVVDAYVEREKRQYAPSLRRLPAPLPDGTEYPYSNENPYLINEDDEEQHNEDDATDEELGWRG